jgi:hypothetical protein
VHRTLLPWVGVVSAFFLAVGWGTVGRAETDFPVNLSGGETSSGHPESDVQVDVTFEGWVGGTGPVPDTDGGRPIGWVAPPGEGGQWKIVLDYCCLSTRQQQHGVTILPGGSWELQLSDGDHFTGSVQSGTVRFPQNLDEDLGCGPGVTKVSATFLFDADEHGQQQPKSSDATACLDDLHDWHPPPIWGTIGKPQH